MKRIGALATVAALALGSLPVLAQVPSAGAQGRPPAASQAPPVGLDIRAGEYPAGDPSGVGQIKPGDGATFSVSVYGYNPATNGYDALQFSELAHELGAFHFVLYYGWGQTGVTTENGCTGIAQHDTRFCYSQSSQTYNPPNKHKVSASSTWVPTTDVKAPATDLSTLFYAIVLEVGNKQIVWSEAGNVEYDLTAKQVFLSSPLGTGAQVVSSGTKVHMTACITDDNCQTGLVRTGNFLGSYLYVCNSWPPFGSGGVPVTKDLPPKGRFYISGKADQVLGGIEQKFTPPPGQDWSVFYYAFASSHPNLALTGICPTSPAEVNAGKLTGITTDFAFLMITWESPPLPPSVSLTASSTHPSANQSVSLTAIATRPDGNSYLYICARSGTSWLSLSPPDSNGYLGAAPVSTPAPKTLGTAVPAFGRSGTAQFVAFLSTDPVHPGSCPVPGAGSAVYGTLAPPDWTARAGPWHASYDYSAAVNVTWPPSPSSPLSGQTSLSVSLSAIPVADVGQTVDLVPRVVGLVPKKYAKVYVCARSGAGPWLRLSGHSSALDPYATADPVPETTYTPGFALGTAPGRATFVAFVSTRTSPPGPQCPLASTASAKWGTGSKADFSAPVTVTWEGHAHTKPPQVSLTASPTDPGFGQPSVVTATYTNPGSADALYICYPGSHPWLQTDYNRPYLDEEPLPSLGQTTGYAVGTPGASGGTAQFVAFLSSKSSPPATCPLTDALGPEWGTTSAADYSNRISVTWAGPPAGRSTVTLSANPANPGAGQRTTFTASYSHPGRANAVYICQLTGPGDITLSGKRPYLAADGVRPGATTGQARGWAKAHGGTTASFIAYLSTEVGQEGSGSCPTAPGRHGAIAISTPVTVSWGSAPPVVVGAGPIVSITVSADQVSNGAPVTITASYQDPGQQASALYITDDGVIPPNSNFMFGYLEPVKHMPYLAARPVPTFPDAAATVSGINETVQFGAFLSNMGGLQFGPSFRDGQQDVVLSPGPGAVSPTFGTTTSADFSPVVEVAWGAPSQGTTITLQASTTKPQHAGDTVVFTATATGMPAGDYLYVCAIPGGSGSFTTEKTGNFLAGPTQLPVASGWASGAGTSADFVAFDSPNPGWGWCPSAPYNWPPAPGTETWYIPTVSNIISVSWPAGPKKVQWWPT